MPSLVVPGVRVETRFDVLPPLPAPSGIVGIVGIVDRPPADGGIVSVTKISELRELLGPGTETSMPEGVHALANGASELVVAPVTKSPDSAGAPASATFANPDGQDAIMLRCRSNGKWGNKVSADIRDTRGPDGQPLRVSIRLFANGGPPVENFDDLQSDPGKADDLYEAINRRSRFVVALDPGLSGAMPEAKRFEFDENGTPIQVLKTGSTTPLLELVPSDEVADPTGLAVETKLSTDKKRAQVLVFQNGLQEDFTGLVMDPDSDRYLPYVVLTQSRFVRVRAVPSLPEGKRLPAGQPVPQTFAGGDDPQFADYQRAIELLADDPRVDIVLASLSPNADRALVLQVHQALLAHAVAMADNGAPRIAFGSIHPGDEKDLNKIREHSATVRNRRFVLVAPSGAAGAAAGMVARMNVQDSPTFKTVPLFGVPPARYRESELNRLLGPATNALVVQDRAGRGVVVLRGLTTAGEQISVMRVADAAVRETKAISENFIGELNNADSRTALKQQIVATFTRMEREGALVPSTDGKDPAFLVDVYSTQLDFAQGIVRIDIAVRPVRAIDYVYATIRVKN